MWFQLYKGLYCVITKICILVSAVQRTAGGAGTDWSVIRRLPVHQGRKLVWRFSVLLGGGRGGMFTSVHPLCTCLSPLCVSGGGGGGGGCSPVYTHSVPVCLLCFRGEGGDVHQCTSTLYLSVSFFVCFCVYLGCSLVHALFLSRTCTNAHIFEDLYILVL